MLPRRGGGLGDAVRDLLESNDGNTHVAIEDAKEQLIGWLEDVLALLRRGQVGAAVAAYGGDLLPGTESPALVELADVVAVAVREALLADPQPAAVARYTELAPYDTEVVETCLSVLGDRHHAAKPLLKGKLAAASR